MLAPVPPRLLPLLAASLIPLAVQAASDTPLLTVVVAGTPEVLAPHDALPAIDGVPDDAAALLTRVPGAAVVRNGPQTGIVQLRGLFNERVPGRVDGMVITPACPNHMDPPLHYASPDALGALDVRVGAVPVSAGGDSLSGSVEARSPAPRFGTTPGWQTQGEADAGYVSGPGGRQFAVAPSAFNDVLNLAYRGSYQEAGNLQSARGEIADTGYRRRQQALTAAYRHGSGVWTWEAGTQRARDVGTPTLPMDMVKDDADHVRLAFEGATPLGMLEAGVYHHQIDHQMDNFSLRPLTGMRMQSPASSDDSGLTLALSRPAGRGSLKLGTEWFSNVLDVYQQNLSLGGLRQDTFRNARRARYAAYGEWEGQLTPEWRLNAGVRGEQVRMDTGDIRDFFGASAAAAAAFNARDHARRDTHLDATLALVHVLQPGLSVQGALTRRTRSPSELERYLWTPLSASAGQADGRTYLGNLDLRPEVAHGLDLGVRLKRSALRLEASAFWQDVRDFIQGQPYAGGGSTLQYANVHARLWGGEASLTQRLGAFDVSAWASLTRGQNTDNGDDLYRIAPLRGGLAAGYTRAAWQVRAEWLLSRRKDHVAAYNGELPTPGYGVLNLHADVTPTRNLKLAAGIDNVFDKPYYDPLAGVNRVSGSVVPVGGILPAMGRSLYVKMNWTY